MEKYILSTVNLPLHVNGEVIAVDSYSFILSRWGQKCLSNGITQLRSDIFWAVHARNLFAYYASNLISCEEIMQRAGVGPEEAKFICKRAGWNTFDLGSWTSLTIWIKAASKYEGCAEYLQIQALGDIPTKVLNEILYYASSSILTELQMIQLLISEFYQCSRPICYYEEMLWMQWSQSTFTRILMKNMEKIGVSLSNSLQSWLPSNYNLPIEWLNYSDLLITKELAAELINFNSFLNPSPVKRFFNSYFTGDLNATAVAFNLPNSTYATAFFKYFQKIVPGTGLFYTAPYHSWVDGFNHPFLQFLYSTSIYEGGNPIAYPFFTVAGNISDAETAPKTVMVSGKDSIKHTRNYYEYYGSKYIRRYGGQLCTFCPNALKFGWTTIWPVDHIFNCSDGGKFSSGFSSSDPLYAFVDLLKKTVKLKYDSTLDYYGLETYKYVVDSSDFQTAEVVPANAGYNQMSWGMSGFYNLSSVFGFPFFMSKPHYYGCDPLSLQMGKIYKYDALSPLSKEILPSKADDPYIVVNPETGVSVKLRFKMMGSIAIYQDYYFSTIAQPVGGKGLYIPYYILSRDSQWTDSMIQKHFGALIQAHFLEKILFYLGIIGGVFMFELAFFIAMIVKRYRTRMHHKRLSIAIRRSIDVSMPG